MPIGHTLDYPVDSTPGSRHQIRLTMRRPTTVNITATDQSAGHEPCDRNPIRRYSP